MSLYNAEPVLDAVVTLLKGTLPAKVGGKAITVTKDADAIPVGVVLVECVVSPVAESIHMGGHDWAICGVQVSSAMWTASQARAVGDMIRTTLVAQNRGGQLATPMAIPGHKVLDVGSMADGHATPSTTTTGVVYQWAETFTIRFT